jgi:PAS domain S-box-containing protein
MKNGLRKSGTGTVSDSPELSQARADIRRLNAELERCAIERREEVAARRRVEEALRAGRERALCYFDLGLVGMAIVSLTEGCMEVNRRLCDILGYEPGELMQMTWAALTHADDLAGDMENYRRILAGEAEGYLKAKRWIRKNGAVVHTNVSVKCQRRADGSVDYFAAMVEEVAGGDAIPDDTDLSRREREVARLIGLGRTVKEVAGVLSLSEKTVSTYRSRILTKLKLKSTAELIRYALKHRLAE